MEGIAFLIVAAWLLVVVLEVVFGAFASMFRAIGGLLGLGREPEVFDPPRCRCRHRRVSRRRSTEREAA